MTRITQKPMISVIVPVHNSAKTIDKCLESIYSSRYKNFEVIVVDDCSTDNSVEVIEKFPCRLIRLEKHAGVSKARNTGAKQARGRILFFTDSDCMLMEDTLERVISTMSREKVKVVGGTYTKVPYDYENFFSVFQSIYVHYTETKNKYPDYIAAHCLAIDKDLFHKLNGFIEDSFIGVAASVEDVELCHRLARGGNRMVMNPDILVKHIVNFSILKSLKNAFKKSMYWTMYSIKNKDLTKDSGAASFELKFSVGASLLNILFIFSIFMFRDPIFIIPVLIISILNILVNLKFLDMIYKTRGLSFTIGSAAYFTLLYPIAVGAGALIGMLKFIWYMKLLRRY